MNLPDAVRSLGGAVLPDDDPAAGARFAALVRDDDPLLPAIARAEPELAVALCGEGDAARLLAALREARVPCFVLNRGPIAGNAGDEGAIELSEAELAALLGEAVAGRLDWEADPDFGYEVAVSTEVLAGERADALRPRVRYALSDRVYEHAEEVVEAKRRRHDSLAAADAPDEVLAATGWPPEPTGSSWRDGD